jgi:hypothetical protein
MNRSRLFCPDPTPPLLFFGWGGGVRTKEPLVKGRKEGSGGLKTRGVKSF